MTEEDYFALFSDIIKIWLSSAWGKSTVGRLKALANFCFGLIQTVELGAAKIKSVRTSVDKLMIYQVFVLFDTKMPSVDL